MKKTCIYIIMILLIIGLFYLGLYFFRKNDNDTISNNKTKIDTILEEQATSKNLEVLNDCIYRQFIPLFTDKYYNYGYDMIFKDKIYHKVIIDYDEYLIYKDRWNSILDMTEKDFKNYFMVITAVENVSMIGLTISDIYNKDGILYIDMDEGEVYYDDATCISIVIPNEMKSENIETRDMRKVREQEEKNPENIYGWKNESIEGLSMITENKAVEIAKEYAQTLLKSNSLAGQYLEKYTKLYEVTLTQRAPNNYWLIEDGIIERNYVTASYERTVYEVILVRYDDEVEMDRAFFYVDAYTREVIGGMEKGD